MPFTPKTIEVSVDSGTAALQNALNNNIKGGSPSLQRLPEPEKTYVGNRYPANLQHWVILTGTYSAVFMCILLISLSLPSAEAGKLYIQFTAFWSLLLYFLTDLDVDDYYASDPFDNVVKSVIKINK